MTTQTDSDFAPFLAAFPHSIRTDCGLPIVMTFVHDAEHDPYPVFFEHDGTLRIDMEGLSYVRLNADILEHLTAFSKTTQTLFAACDETPSGKAWHAAAV